MDDELIRVAVVFGGRSSEHPISCVSAGSVLGAIDRSKYQVIPVGISESGRWLRQPDDPDRMRLTDGKLPKVSEDAPVARLSLDPAETGVWFEEPDGSTTWEPIDVVFPVLHGPNGEDGSIQGLFELAGLPYVGSGVFASAACMDKGFTKTILAAAGLPAGEWVSFHAGRWADEPEAVLSEIESLSWPLFVKPARAGSSVGVSKARTAVELRSAIEEALEHDPRVIVEESVENAQEIECGVLALPDGEVATSVCAEIKVREGHDFYDFEAKYLDDSVDLRVPADISDSQMSQLQALASRAFGALSCEGLARVDFFLTADGTPIINEVNTMPGFTSISMFPSMWAHTGVSYPDLIDTLLQEALGRAPGLR